MIKRLKTELIILISTAVTILGMVTGCALFQLGSKTEFNTLAGVGYTTDRAVTAYYDGIATGIIKTNNAPAVKKAYNDFQTGYKLVLDAASSTNGVPRKIMLSNGSDIMKLEQNVLNLVGGIQ